MFDTASLLRFCNVDYALTHCSIVFERTAGQHIVHCALVHGVKYIHICI